MRGYLYEVVTDPDWAGELDESVFYDKCGYIADFFKNSAHEPHVRELLELFRQYGAETGIEDTDNGQLEWFVFAEEVRKKYFETRFNKAKEMLSNMTLEQFSKNISQLQEAIEDEYGDAVYLNGCFYTMDDFIRNLEIDKKYYLGNVVMMH